MGEPPPRSTPIVPEGVVQRITLVVLLLLAAGLGAFVYFYEIKGEASREAAKDAEQQLFKVDKDKVTQIRIKNEHGAFELEHGDSGWQLTSPKQLDADTSAAEDVLYAVDALRIKQTVDEKPSDLEPYGLTSPKFEVTFQAGEGEQTLQVGDDAPFGGLVYLKKGDTSTVYLSSYPIRSKLDKDLNGWRNKKIIDFSVSDVQRIRVEGTDQEPLEVKRDGSSWRLANPPGYRLDANHFDTLLYDVLGLTALDFTGETDPSAFGLEPPRWTLTLFVGEDNAQKQLLFGNPDIETRRIPVVREAGEEVRMVRMSIKDSLSKSASALRDKKVVPLERYLIQSLSIEIDAGKIEATKKEKENEWALEGTLKDKLQSSDIDAVLNDLADLSADTLLDDVPPSELASYGLETPALAAVLSEGGPEGAVVHKCTLRLGKGQAAHADHSYAAVDGDPTVYQINRFVLDDVLALLLKPKTDTPKPEGSSDATAAPDGEVPE